MEQTTSRIRKIFNTFTTQDLIKVGLSNRSKQRPRSPQIKSITEHGEPLITPISQNRGMARNGQRTIGKTN